MEKRTSIRNLYGFLILKRVLNHVVHFGNIEAVRIVGTRYLDLMPMSDRPWPIVVGSTVNYAEVQGIV